MLGHSTSNITHEKNTKVASSAEKVPPASFDLTFRAISARVESLLRRGTSEKVNALLDDILTNTPVSRLSERDRSRFLLFVAAGVAAARTNRLKPEDVSFRLFADMSGRLGETPHGAMIERHKTLLARLVISGCELRGEIPHRSSYRKGAADANA